MRVSALAWLFGFTMFVAALLLFSVQPMIGKMVLPILGGTPGVWNTCLVFFQADIAGRICLRPCRLGADGVPEAIRNPRPAPDAGVRAPADHGPGRPPAAGFGEIGPAVLALRRPGS